MKGFLRRDFYLIRGNLWFYLCFLAVFGVLVIFTDFSASFLSLYFTIFAMSSVMGLFNYDDYNGWLAYAAAMPNGRRAAVYARYLLTALVGLVGLLFCALLTLLDTGVEELGLAMVYGGVFFLYSAVVLPVCYRFGGTKARTVLVVAVAFLSAGVGVAGAILNISGGRGHMTLPSVVYLSPVVGLAVFLLSLPVSRRIAAKKEF